MIRLTLAALTLCACAPPAGRPVHRISSVTSTPSVAPTPTPTPIASARTLPGPTVASAPRTPLQIAARAGAGSIWDALADCESGLWDRHKRPIPGTANWASSTGHYEGGVHFTNSTWLGAGGGRYARHAYAATRDQQIEIARVVLRQQGPGAWPTCSRKVGLTRAAA